MEIGDEGNIHYLSVMQREGTEGHRTDRCLPMRSPANGRREEAQGDGEPERVHLSQHRRRIRRCVHAALERGTPGGGRRRWPSDEVEVTIELDTAPRTVEVPADLAAALAAQPGAAAAFDALSYTMRKEYVRQVEEAKAQETRARRIAGIVAKVAP